MYSQAETGIQWDMVQHWIEYFVCVRGSLFCNPCRQFFRSKIRRVFLQSFIGLVHRNCFKRLPYHDRSSQSSLKAIVRDAGSAVVSSFLFSQPLFFCQICKRGAKYWREVHHVLVLNLMVLKRMDSGAQPCSPGVFILIKRAESSSPRSQ